MSDPVREAAGRMLFWLDCQDLSSEGERLSEALRAALAQAPMSEQPGLREAAEAVLIGGNHLANQLVGLGCMPDEEADYDAVLERFGSLCADLWVAWHAIMQLRAALAQPPSAPPRREEVREKLEFLRDSAAKFGAILGDKTPRGWGEAGPSLTEADMRLLADDARCSRLIAELLDMMGAR